MLRNLAARYSIDLTFLTRCIKSQIVGGNVCFYLTVIKNIAAKTIGVINFVRFFPRSRTGRPRRCISSSKGIDLSTTLESSKLTSSQKKVTFWSMWNRDPTAKLHLKHILGTEGWIDSVKKPWSTLPQQYFISIFLIAPTYWAFCGPATKVPARFLWKVSLSRNASNFSLYECLGNGSTIIVASFWYMLEVKAFLEGPSTYILSKGVKQKQKQDLS